MKKKKRGVTITIQNTAINDEKYLEKWAKKISRMMNGKRKMRRDEQDEQDEKEEGRPRRSTLEVNGHDGFK
jgi:hypothetical protein